MMKRHDFLVLLLLLWTTLASAQNVRIGLVTDVHYAEKPSGTKRAYRDSLKKLDEAVAALNEAKADFVVELGDFIDSAPTLEGEIGHARTINAVFQKFHGPRHYVVGNHDVAALTKTQFLEACGAKTPHYSFDHGAFHFIVLDACYSPDGTTYGARKVNWVDTEIPPAEREWLAADLKATDKKTVCFVHQKMDIVNKHTIKSAPDIRKILEDSGKVLAVMQGHAHTNALVTINGIHYWTLHAMVETPGGYSLLEISTNNTLRLTGFRGHTTYEPLPATQP
jgi:alkaline phosphatase